MSATDRQAPRPHVVFFEPRYAERTADLWNIRGGNKYPGIIGHLADVARVTILMSTLPPLDNPHRKRLERDLGVSFAEVPTAFHHSPGLAEPLAKELTASLRELGATVVSNLNGRAVGFMQASAMAAREIGARFVARIGGNDLEVRGKFAELRDLPFFGTSTHLELIRQERIAVHLADAVIVMSKRELQRVSGLCANPAKVHVCIRGVDQTHFRPAERHRVPCARFLYVGRKRFEKGYDILEAAADELELTGSDVRISFAGTFRPSETGIRRYLGFVNYPDLPELYRAHDALVLCSRSEGFGQVIMEAMSCGLPCILTRRLFEHDFTHEVDCLLVEPEAAAVAGAMRRMREDAALFHRLRAASIARARRFWSEEENRSIYQNVLLGDVSPMVSKAT